jgi:CRP/FNR family transcriptional regulator
MIHRSMSSYCTYRKKTETDSQDTVACHCCALSQICFPEKIAVSALQKLESIIVRHTPRKKGHYWFREYDKFRSIFAVRSGCIKTYKITESGDEQICGFYLPGEIIGLDAVDNGVYTSYARVLQPSSVCEIPFVDLVELCDQHADLKMHLLGLMSRELHKDQWLITLLGKNTADERVAALLCNLSHRLKQRGYSPTDFILGMPRSDIGNYLGLAVETVSRVFTRFQKDRLIEAKGKHIRIANMGRLHQLAGFQQTSLPS